jgi:1-acylglycerone phosphate reductase
MAKKTILITGCSSGIGHALALEFHSTGHRVFATARNTSSITDLAERGIETLPLEANSDSSIETLRVLISLLTDGSLDFLYNNIGRNYTVPALDTDINEIRDTFETNVFSVMKMCQAFAPLLIKAKGTIIQTGSLAGIMPYPFGSVYNASKAALHSYSDTLRLELAPYDVKVITVVTGGVLSNLARVHRTLPEGSFYLPWETVYEGRLTHSQANGIPAEEYAQAVVKQIMKDPSRDRIWEGGKAWLVWFAHTFLPRFVLVSLIEILSLVYCAGPF